MEKERAKDRARNQTEKRKRQNRHNNLVAWYGITLADYEAMVEKQGGKCALCGGPPHGKGNKLHVDHCHVEGHVRGLLCSPCNLALGGFKHDPLLLELAVEYLDRSAKPVAA